MKLKIFSERSYLPQGIAHEPILFPFWGNLPENSGRPWSRIFDSYTEMGRSLFEMSSLEEADLAVMPVNWEPVFSSEDLSLPIQLVKKAKQAKKPVVSFFSGDCSHLKLPVKSDLVFRHSLYRSVKQANDFAFPAWSQDLLEKYFNSQLSIRRKRAKPIVGFCGFSVSRTLKTYLKFFLHWSEKLFVQRKIPRYHIGHVLRTLALSVLSKSRLIEANFVERDRLFFHEPNLALQEKIQQEFVQNMRNSDYVFCCRGSGNYSFRFYEALCCGRIPVFLNTNCVLPYDFEIDWKKYCVWVDESELPFIAEKIAEFHDNLSPQEFIDLQHECRRIWEERISPEGFFANLYRHIPIAFSARSQEESILVSKIS
jgi:hypothetical protein